MRCWEQHANNLTKAIRWGLLEDKEVVPMRRLKLILAALAMMLVMMAASAAPAIANHDNDGWWDNCDWVIVGWHWIPPWFWGALGVGTGPGALSVCPKTTGGGTTNGTMTTMTGGGATATR